MSRNSIHLPVNKFLCLDPMPPKKDIDIPSHIILHIAVIIPFPKNYACVLCLCNFEGSISFSHFGPFILEFKVLVFLMTQYYQKLLWASHICHRDAWP